MVRAKNDFIYEVAENLTKQRLMDLIKEGRYLDFGGYLDLRGTNITQLPDTLKVKGQIYR